MYHEIGLGYSNGLFLNTGCSRKTRAAVPAKTSTADGLIGKIATKGRPNT